MPDVSIITERGDNSPCRCWTRVVKAIAKGEDGGSAKTPRVRDEPVTPRETCAGVSIARGLSFPRVRSLAKAVTAESIRHRVNSRTASASTAQDPNDSDTGPEVDIRLDRMIISHPFTVGAMAVPLGSRAPAPKTGVLSDSGKQLNLSWTITERTANSRLGSVAARISRMDQRRTPSSAEVGGTG